MRVRDAVEADAEAMAAIADGPTDVMRNLVHDRTVRVAEFEPDVDDAPEPDAESADSDQDAAEPDAEPAESNSEATVSEDASTGDTTSSMGEESTPLDTLAGFVSFDAKADVVHVTQIDGTADACELLLAEPVRFAEHEGMRVELLVTDPDGDVAAAAERLGFERDGPGPRFAGESTIRFGLQPS